MKKYIKGGVIITEGTPILITVNEEEHRLYNPMEQHYLEYGWTKYIPTFEEQVIAKVREVYSIDQELAILRQRDSKPEEFQAYFEYVESSKNELRQEE